MRLTSVSDKIVFGEIECDFSESSSPTPYAHTPCTPTHLWNCVCAASAVDKRHSTCLWGEQSLLETMLQCFHIVSVCVYIHNTKESPAKL